MVGPLAPHLDVKIEVTSGLQIKWRAGPSHMIMICWFLRFKICDIDLFPTICKFLQLVAPNPIWLLYNYMCCICHTVFLDYPISPAQTSSLALPGGCNGRDLDGGATQPQHAAFPPTGYGSVQRFEGTLVA